MLSRLKSVVVHLALLVGVVVVDLFSKLVVISTIGENAVAIIPGVTINVMMNNGIAWSVLSSLGAQHRSILIFIVVSILAGFFIFAIKEFIWRGSAIPETLICGGGLANLIDRLWHGGVVDFVSLHVGGWRWPTFNLADVAIVVGVAMLVWKALRELPARSH